MDEEKRKNSKGDWDTEGTQGEKNEDNKSEEKSWESDEDLDAEEASVEVEKKPKEKNQKKIQNLMATIIVLGGLFAGSLFVDVAQLIRGEGISLRKLESVDVFTAGDKTWISSNDPIIEMMVISDEDCEECQPEAVIDAIKKTALPTLVAKKIDVNSKEGQKLLDTFNLKAIPAFIFNEEVKDTPFYEQAEQVLTEKDGLLILDNALAGIPYGKYIVLPDFEAVAVAKGNKDAELEVIIFGDFQCPFSKQFDETFNKVYEKYQDKMKVSFHQYPLISIHPNAFNAAMASLCANDQGKFWEMAGVLFDNQEVWGKKDAGKSVFAGLTTKLGIDVAEFKKCLDSDEHKTAVEADIKTAADFSLGGTPSIFIGDKFFGGAVTEETLTEVVEGELGIANENESEAKDTPEKSDE